jgi:aarF domain-containing kinase
MFSWKMAILLLILLLHELYLSSGSIGHLKPSTFPKYILSQVSGASSQKRHVSVNNQTMTSKSGVDYDQVHYSINRDLEFWKRSIEIFSSYKRFQFKQAVSNVALRLQGQALVNDESRWNELHELNSDRMYNLCVDLRGFYLKAGQFLGTRYDFMPTQYTTKLAKLHDDVTPMPEQEAKDIIEQELHSSYTTYFSKLDLKSPLGAASIAQVHLGTWKPTNEKVAVKIQYPHAERLMKSDLKNLRALAEFLQRTELKFDLLTCIKELQRRIVNEFDFMSEKNNLEYMRQNLMPHLHNVVIPKPIYSTRRLLVMSFVEGENLGRLAEFRDKPGFAVIPKWLKQQFGKRLLDVLSTAWGYQIFVLRRFNADPHPVSTCLSSTDFY